MISIKDSYERSLNDCLRNANLPLTDLGEPVAFLQNAYHAFTNGAFMVVCSLAGKPNDVARTERIKRFAAELDGAPADSEDPELNLVEGWVAHVEGANIDDSPEPQRDVFHDLFKAGIQFFVTEVRSNTTEFDRPRYERLKREVADACEHDEVLEDLNLH